MISNPTLLEQMYLALLRHPHDSWRVENQALYVRVREALCAEVGGDSQEVQEYYEQIANNP